MRTADGDTLRVDLVLRGSLEHPVVGVVAVFGERRKLALAFHVGEAVVCCHGHTHFRNNLQIAKCHSLLIVPLTHSNVHKICVMRGVNRR